MATSKIKDRYMTIRLPADIERELRKMAERNTRTLAAQILHCVKMEMERQQAQENKA
jgi:predicted transcriptional regulator